MNILTVLVDCKEPSVPANGIMSATNGTKYGANVEFGCDTGFRLIGRMEGRITNNTFNCFLLCVKK